MSDLDQHEQTPTEDHDGEQAAEVAYPVMVTFHEVTDRYDVRRPVLLLDIVHPDGADPYALITDMPTRAVPLDHLEM